MKTLKAFHAIAVVNAILTVAMVLLGAYVKNSGSSLACPDWPTCHGSLMPDMVGGVAIEHSHRILGSILGILSLTLLFLSFLNRKTHSRLFQLSTLAVVIVVFQGVLGGVTVLKQISPHISTVHLVTSQIYFAILLLLCFKSHYERSGIIHFNSVDAKTSRFLTIAMIVFMIQIILGAIVRHSGAGVSCGLGWQSAVQCIHSVSGESVWWPDTLLAKLQMKHRYWGIITMFAVVFGTLPFLKWAKRNRVRNIRLSIVILHISLLLQILVGALALGSHLSNHAVLTHVFLAMSMWGILVYLRFKACELKGNTN